MKRTQKKKPKSPKKGNGDARPTKTQVDEMRARIKRKMKKRKGYEIKTTK